MQRDERSQSVACSGSSLAQIIGAIGPSSARRTSLIGIVLGRAGELVAAVGAARAGHQAGLAQAHDELLEIGAREVLFGGDLGERRRAPCPTCRPSWTISRTPYSPFVEKAMAPLPW